MAGVRISMRSLYTPMLLLTLLVIAHLLVRWAPKVEWRYRFTPAHPWLAAVMVVTAAVLLSPVLVAYGDRLLHGQMAGPAIYWRSSPPGVDLLAFVMPNPNSPWFGQPFKAWIEAQRVDGFAELTGALPLVALAVIGVAWAWAGWRPARRRWIWMPAVFAALALGPFVHVAGINTYIPGPWALLRYVPIVGLARSPSRFVVLVALGVAILFALALAAIGERWPHRRRARARCGDRAPPGGVVTSAAAVVRGHGAIGRTTASLPTRGPTSACCRCRSAFVTARRRSATSTRSRSTTRRCTPSGSSAATCRG